MAVNIPYRSIVSRGGGEIQEINRPYKTTQFNARDAEIAEIEGIRSLGYWPQR